MSSVDPGGGELLAGGLRALASPRGAWWVKVIVGAAAVVAVLLLLLGFYRRELNHLTGSAEWIWVSDQVRESRASGGVFVRRFNLAARPRRAVAKICGDRQYVLWVNGLPAAAGLNRPRFQLDLVPVTDLLQAGVNTIAIEARSHTSVGAVLFALDLEPTIEGQRAGDPVGRCVLVSDRSWTVHREWAVDTDAGESTGVRRAWVWGRPPDHPWSYPRPVVHRQPLVQSVVSDPVRFRHGQQSGPDGGLTASLDREADAMLWLDLGEPKGEVRVLGSVTTADRTSRGAGEEITVPVVVLPGQRLWLFPGTVRGPVQLHLASDERQAVLELVELAGNAYVSKGRQP